MRILNYFTIWTQFQLTFDDVGHDLMNNISEILLLAVR